MKNITILMLLASFSMGVTGCSKTWTGLKQDSSSLWEDTRGVIHEASSPVGTTNKAQDKVNTSERTATKTLSSAAPYSAALGNKVNVEEVKEEISTIE